MASFAKKLASFFTVCTIVGSALKNFKCFIAGTLVLCMDKDGNQCHKPIEDVKVGDMVWAYDEETGETAYKPVVRLFRNESKDWTGVTVNGLEIVSTPGHKYFLPETKKWVSAEDLKVGVKVLLSDGSYGIIEAVRAIHYDVPQTTYNFEVYGFHTYYVGTGVLVHNMNGIDCSGRTILDYEETPAFRGGNDFQPKPGEIPLTKQGFVKLRNGPSVNIDPAKVVQFGTPTRITYISEGLHLVQTGTDLGHFVIAAARQNMPYDEYLYLLSLVNNL